jgi:transcriptional regulator with PAS, ATPase and Fis domain
MVREGSAWMIEDAGSRNGTFVDGKRVAQRVALHEQAIIELGRTALWFATGEGNDLADTSAQDLPTPLPGISTFDAAFARQLSAGAKLATSNQSIILFGETGTGKEVVARAIHTASRRSGPFVAVNCGALPPSLIESELFGFKKGAFSGAIEDRPGLIRGAQGGTLFLDEIGDLPATTQAALLRVLQEREVLPIGATRPIAVDLRLLCASHRDLEVAAAKGEFREDLLARLSGYVLKLPPLRERREDLGILIASLLTRLGADPQLRFAPEAGYAIVRYGWPRNVRELEQALSTAVALASSGVIELEHLPPNLQPDVVAKVPDEPLDLSPSEVKRRDRLIALLVTHRGNISAVADAMGKHRAQIHRWIERYALDLDRYRK